MKREYASWDSVPIITTLLGDAEARGNKSFPKLFCIYHSAQESSLGLIVNIILDAVSMISPHLKMKWVMVHMIE
ncbi:hypothetical protein COL31_18220 [Bacillus pseudomycoides]|nr:hypothetical protein COL31_18220 [Bacillus pseudomycoides]PFZ84108.1 hypothetical protein COL69_08780 [Bacillus pseudomycoides]PGE15772.1 hypothetical protein COM51_18915 [Bacillus pseudomycoides]